MTESGFIEAEFYTCFDDEENLLWRDVQDAVDELMQRFCTDEPVPEVATVYAFDPIKLSIKDIPEALEWMIEILEEEHGDPNGDYPYEPSDRVRIAHAHLRDALLFDYRPWMCKLVGQFTVRVKDYVDEADPD